MIEIFLMYASSIEYMVVASFFKYNGIYLSIKHMLKGNKEYSVDKSKTPFEPGNIFLYK